MSTCPSGAIIQDSPYGEDRGNVVLTSTQKTLIHLNPKDMQREYSKVVFVRNVGFGWLLYAKEIIQDTGLTKLRNEKKH